MDCNVIRDLLPLYADGLTGDASNAAIEEHIKTCPECARVLEQMRTPIEPEPVDEATAYMNALHAQERRRKRRTILACVATALVCVIGFWIYMETHFYGEQIVTVSTDGEEILAEMPDLALTQAEMDLAETILETPAFREALNYETFEVTVLDTNEAVEAVASVLPDNAVIGEIGVMGAVVYIDYRYDNLRVILEYVDGDGTGHVDAIRKGVAVLEPTEPVNGVEYAPDVSNVYHLVYAAGTGIIQYEKTEAQHIWFGFMNMP